MLMGSAALSLCMILKNEERTLPRCLDSVRSLAPEIVIIDTGSTDATPAIAMSYGAKLIALDFTTVNFAAARNHALAHAQGRWILVLDADETLHPASACLIQKAMAREEDAGYYFQRVNHHLDTRDNTTDYVVRLFQNRPAYRYRGRVHETIDASILAGGGRLRRTAIRIDHDFATDPETRRQRNLWYIGILNEEIAADPGDHSRLVFLRAEYQQLGMFDRAAEIAERLVSLRPLDPEAHLDLGIYHLLYKRDHKRASGDFKEALRLRPGFTDAQTFLQRIEEQERASERQAVPCPK